MRYITHLRCPKCNEVATFNQATLQSTSDSSTVSIAFTCQECGHLWNIEFQLTNSGELYLVVDEERTLPQQSALVTEPLYLSSQTTQVVKQTPLEAQDIQNVTQNLAHVEVSRSVFWGMLIALFMAIGGIGALWNMLQQQKDGNIVRARQEVALITMNATATASYHATNTAESRLHTATAFAISEQSTRIAATNIAEQKATATSAFVATANTQSTVTAQLLATATAQKIATTSVKKTSTAQRIGTATTEARFTPTPTKTPIPAPKINVRILGCDTGFDVLDFRRGVTNAWVTIENVGDGEAKNVEVTLYSENEQSVHPDKSEHFYYFPPRHGILLKLTVDTHLLEESFARVVVRTEEGIMVTDYRATCSSLDENATRLIELAGEVGKLVPLEVGKLAPLIVP